MTSRAAVPVEGIYLIELHDGTIKLGRSSNLASRLREHAGHVTAYGLKAVSVWSHAVPDSTAAESLVLRMLAGHADAEPVTASCEVWTGISMAEAVMTALAVLRSPKLFKLAEPIGVDQRSPGRSHLAEDLHWVFRDPATTRLHSSEILAQLRDRRPEDYTTWDTTVLSLQIRRELNQQSTQIKIAGVNRAGYRRSDLMRVLSWSA